MADVDGDFATVTESDPGRDRTALDLQDVAIRAEADAFLERHRVLDLLRCYGTPHISGSYAMQLMTWRDLDIYLAMLYCGVLTDDLAKGGWKIDLWGVNRAVCDERLAYCRSLSARMDASVRQSILTVKNELCRLPAYRRTITSHQIYEAVISGGVRSVGEFWNWIKRS
jgi:hypothetical protein